MTELKNAKVAQLSALYVLAAAFPAVLQVFLQPFIEGPNELGVLDFANLAIAETIAVICMLLCTMSMGNGLVRFYYDHIDEDSKLSELRSSVLSSMLIRAVMIFAVVYVLQDFFGTLFSSEALQDFASYGFLAAGIGITRGINLASANLLRNQKKVSQFVSLSTLMGLIRVGFQVYFLFWIEMSFLSFLWGSCIGGAVVTLVVTIYVYGKGGLKYNREMLAPVRSFSLPLFAYALVNWGVLFIDRFFLEGNSLDLGIYDTAMKFALGVDMVLTGINGAIRPELFRKMKEGVKENQEDIRRLGNLMMLQVSTAIAFLIIPVMLYIDVFFETALVTAAAIIPLVFIRFLQKGQFFLFTAPLYYEKKTKHLFLISCFGLAVNIGLNFFLIELYGMYGAIISSIATFTVLSVIAFVVEQRVLSMNWNRMKVLFTPLIILFTVLCGSYLGHIQNWNIYLCGGLASSLILIINAILYNEEIKTLTQKLIGK